MRWIKKDCNLFNGLDVLYHRAKFEEDRTTRAGCRCENMVVFSRTLRGRRAVCSRGIIWTYIVSPFTSGFWCGLLFFFSEEIVLSDVLQSAFFVARLRNNFREIAVTNCEKSNLSYRGKPVLRTVASLGACGRLAVLNWRSSSVGLRYILQVEFWC